LKARWGAADGPAGAAHVAGAAEAHRQHQALEHDGSLHQSDPDEDRVMFGNPETTTGATRSSSTLPCASTSGASAHQARRGSDRFRDAREGREEQGRRPSGLPISTSSTAKHLPRGGSSSLASCTRSSTSPRLVHLWQGPHRPGQGQRADYLKQHPELAEEVEAKVRAAVGIGAQQSAAVAEK